MKIKVLYIIGNEFFGGGERTFLQFASGLDKNAFAPVFVSAPNAPLNEELKTAGVKHIAISFKKRFSLSAVLKLRKIFLSERPAIVHSQSARVDFHVRLAALLIGNILLKPILISTVAAPVSEYDVAPAVRLFYSLLDRAASNLTDHFISVTRALQSKLTARLAGGADRTSTIYNGVETDRFDPSKYDRGSFRKELGILNDEYLVCAIGRLANVKDHTTLIDAAKLLFEENPSAKVKFAVIGSGELMPELKNTISAYKLSEKIILTGARNDIPEILAACDIFALTSIREGFPIAVLEAMAMKKPVICTDFEGVDEVLKNDINALIVPRIDPAGLKKAVLELMGDPQKAARLAESAASMAATSFTLKHTIGLHEQLYRALLLTKLSSIRKILIVNVSGIGDFLESIAALTAIRKKYPEARITLLVSSKVYDYAKGCPSVDEVMQFPVNKARGFPDLSYKSVTEVFHIFNSLRRQRYDIALNFFRISTLAGSVRMNLLFKYLRPRLSVGRISRGLGGFYDIRIDDGNTPDKNVYYWYGEISKAIGATQSQEDLQLWYDADNTKVTDILTAAGIKPNGKIAILNPGSDRVSRRWQPENFAKVGDILAEKCGYKVILTGGPNEKGLAASVAAIMKSKAFSTAGVFTYAELVALVARSSLVITTHSSMMHLSGLLGVATVAIAGSGHNPMDVPQADLAKMKILFKQIECNPCIYYECPKKDTMKCMKMITPAEVIQSCERFIG